MSELRRIRNRDDGLRRVTRLTGAVVGGGVLATGGFAVLANQQFQSTQVASAATPTTAPATASTSTAPSGTQASVGDDDAAPASTTLTPPTTAPRSAARSVPTTVPRTAPATARRATTAAPAPVIVYNPPPPPRQTSHATSGGS